MIDDKKSCMTYEERERENGKTHLLLMVITYSTVPTHFLSEHYYWLPREPLFIAGIKYVQLVANKVECSVTFVAVRYRVIEWDEKQIKQLTRTVEADCSFLWYDVSKASETEQFLLALALRRPLDDIVIAMRGYIVFLH